MIQVVFWVVTMCSDVVGYQHSEDLATILHWYPIVPLMPLHGVTIQKTVA